MELGDTLNISICFIKVDVLPHSGIEVPLKFSPSALGRGLHEAQVIFKSEEVIVFVAFILCFPSLHGEHITCFVRKYVCIFALGSLSN